MLTCWKTVCVTYQECIPEKHKSSLLVVARSIIHPYSGSGPSVSCSICSFLLLYVLSNKMLAYGYQILLPRKPRLSAHCRWNTSHTKGIAGPKGKYKGGSFECLIWIIWNMWNISLREAGLHNRLRESLTWSEWGRNNPFSWVGKAFFYPRLTRVLYRKKLKP